MSLMHALSVPVFVKTLTALSGVLDKAAAHAEARKINPSVLLGARLFPDMFPLARQVQIACDFAKGAAARLAGQEPPAFEDNEASFDELKARIAKTVDYVQSVPESAFAGSEARAIEVKGRERTLNFTGSVYLAHFVLPNFFFHATTAYDILRHNGVELGKKDFIGPL